MLKIIFWIYTLVVAFLSFYPVPETPTSDKLNHFIAFFIYPVLLKLSYKKGYFETIVLSLLFGIFIEVVQYFLPYRSGEFADLTADFLGILSGVFILFTLDLSKYDSKSKSS